MYLAPNREDAERIIAHPDIWPYVSDDGSVDPDVFELQDEVMTVVCYDPDPVACTVFHWRNTCMVETHVQVLQDARRKSFGYGKAMRVIESDHKRFSNGTRFDFGFFDIATDEGYTIISLPMDKE